jgi:hypothetical protein
MSPNRAMMESLASDHQAQLHADAAGSTAARHRTSASARSRAGWFLIGVGMRMAAGRGADNNQMNAAVGR